MNISNIEKVLSASRENGDEKLRIIQELVPGKQITLAHIIANPDPVLYQKLGLDPSLTIRTPPSAFLR